METPSSSTRRVTRSQTLAAVNNNIPISRKIEDSEKGLTKSRKRTTAAKQLDRSVLIDITNDSPIVGLAMGSLKTPSSGLPKQRTFRGKDGGTPGSGEILLRGQVKTLMQKVEEEAVLSKLSLESRPFPHLEGHVNSPLLLLAPTPTNTPQILSLSGVDDNGLASMNPSPVTQEQLISQVVVGSENEKNLTRSLLLDFSEKLEFSNSECSSVVTSKDDDDSSIWSIQVNASSTHDEEDCDEDNEEEEEEKEEYDDDNKEGLLLDELCEGVSRISVNATSAKFAGKHTRFMYNSDEEIVEECEADGGLSPNVLRLQGLPTPKGKHLRFHTEEQGSD